MKKKRTSLWLKAFTAFTITFIAFVYAKSDFFEYTEIKALQIAVALFIVGMWSMIEDTSGKYKD